MTTNEDMTVLDPFNLRDLVQDTDRRIFGIITHNYEKVVPEAKLTAVKDRLREAAAPLAVEMMNDVQELQGRLGITDIINTTRRLPDPKMMAERFPSVFTAAPQDDQEFRQWAVLRVQWAFDLWLHLSGTLLQRVAPDKSVTVDVVGADGETIRVTRPRELESFSSGWGLVARATGEYLAAKSDLLRAYGFPAPHMTVTFDRGQDRTVKSALDAFWSDQEHTPHAVLQALRGVLIGALGLDREPSDFDLRRLLTSDMVGISQSAGLLLPFPMELLGNLTANLEDYDARCEMPPVFFLFPCARILLRAAEVIAATPPDANVAARASAVLRGSVVQEGDAPASSSGGQENE